jgi:N-acetylglucosamine malate deacetylase 1
MNILVVSPHPDDDILGCGGSIINHIKKGNQVSILYLTSGESGDATIQKNDLATIREKEATSGAETLGVSDVTFLHETDGGVTFNPSIIKTMTEIFRQKHPDILYIPHKHEGHRDHRITSDICMEAIYRSGANAFGEYEGKPHTVGTVLAYEVWTPLSSFSYMEDISDVMEQKVIALKKHASQLKNVAYDEAIRGLNRYRGALTGKGIYCECFEVVTASSFHGI